MDGKEREVDVELIGEMCQALPASEEAEADEKEGIEYRVKVADADALSRSSPARAAEYTPIGPR